MRLLSKDREQRYQSLDDTRYDLAAILLREKAAYRNTSFQLASKTCRMNGLAAKAIPETGAVRPRRLDCRKASQMQKGLERRWN